MATAPIRIGLYLNPVSDANAVANALKSCGFKVNLIENATKSQMLGAITDFTKVTSQGRTKLFYYTGHGIQISSDNYLVPIDFISRNIQSGDLENMKYNTIRLDDILQLMNKERVPSSGSGLVRLAPSRDYIILSSSPNTQPSDGEKNLSLFAEALLLQLKQPGLEIKALFKNLEEHIMEVTHGNKILSTSYPDSIDFYFLPQEKNQFEKEGLNIIIIDAGYAPIFEHGR